MFEINVTSADVSNGSIPVSWCMDMETIAYLSAHNSYDPQVVIVTAPEGERYADHKESRQVVPLNDLMAYVSFKTAGKNKVWAFICKKGAKHAKDKFLSKSDGTYNTSVLNSDGTDWGWTFQHEDQDTESPERRPAHGSSVEVEVPAEAFAAEPSAREKNYVNHFFKGKVVDQCEFRRRRLFAYLVQPFVLALFTLTKLIFTVLALGVGARGLSLKPLFSPLAFSIGDTCKELFCEGSIFIKHLPEDDDTSSEMMPFGDMFSYAFRSFYLVPLMPIFLIPVVLAILFKPVALAIGFAIVLGVILALIIVCFFASGASKKAYYWLRDQWNGEPGPAWYTDSEEITLLTCNPDKKPLTFKTLPPKKRTLRLRFLNLKSKVCRPFSA